MMLKDLYLKAKEVLIEEPFSKYNLMRGSHLSSTSLKTFISESPCDYKFQKENPDNDKLAFLIGRAVHCLFLEGYEQFDNEFVIGGPCDNHGKEYGFKSEKFQNEAQLVRSEQGKELITREIFTMIKLMKKSAMKHEKIQRIMEIGVSERSGRTNFFDVNVQMRADWLSPVNLLNDLKSTADLHKFERDCYRYGYIHSAAFYQSILAKLLGIDDFLYVPFTFIAIEKKPPYKAGVFEVSEKRLSEYRDLNNDAIYELSQCIKNDVWPSGYEELQTIN